MMNPSILNPQSTSLTGELAKKNLGTLEQDLAAFAHRFPVSGRIVHALAQEYGGVVGLAECIEKNGMTDEARGWYGDAKPSALRPEDVRNLFDSSTLDAVAQHLAIPRESVEIQAALGIPKFFGTLAHDDDELDFGYAMSKKKAGKGGKRASASPP